MLLLRHIDRVRHLIVLLAVTLGVVAGGVQTAVAQAGTGMFRVSVVDGSDSETCGSVADPCKSIQKAVNLAAANDTILVAGGTYTYPSASEPCFDDHTGVVCIWKKSLTILGGYGLGTWDTPNPAANLTVIDGENSQRCIRIAESEDVQLEGLTLTNGLALPKDTDDNAFGGGLSAVLSGVVLRDIVFSNNLSRGRNIYGSSGPGGSGAGGGLSIKGVEGTQVSVLLERVVFENNRAEGGTGPESGGFGIGGGFFVNYSDVTGTDLEFRDNTAVAGSSAGNGSIQGKEADGLGGGVAFMKGSVAVVHNLTATGNTAIGGDAATMAGSGYGAAVYGEVADFTLVDALLSGNTSYGGSAATGGRGVGGALMTLASDVALERVSVTNNMTQGGAGSVYRGAGGGGGAFFEDKDGSKSVSLVNCIVAGNSVNIGGGGGDVIGGGGGGLFFLGAQADVTHTSVADNWIDEPKLQGRGMVLVTRLGLTGSNVDFSFGIVANHSTSLGDAAIRVKDESVLNLDEGLFANNGTDYIPLTGTINGIGSMLIESDADFVAPGSPDFDYHLQDTSPAIGEAIGTTTAHDVDGGERDAEPDLGADEYGALAPFIFDDGFENGSFSAWSGSP